VLGIAKKQLIMRVLIVTKIFPNCVEPTSSPFNRQQFAALSRLCDVEVLATIPWFPAAAALAKWSNVGRLARVPRRDRIDGLPVRHPRFAYLPRVGRGLTGPLYAASLAPIVLPYRGRVDAVLGAWAYPDGFASVIIAELLGVPAVIKLHGSDINVLSQWPATRQRLKWALARARRIVAVSRPLAERAAELGAMPERIDVVPNGIDREAFCPRDKADARRELGLPPDDPVVLYVGHVTEEKGALDLVRAFGESAALRRAKLVFVGDGAGVAACRELARATGVAAELVGAQPHAAIPTWLAACDLLCLPSWNEGMPNVVVEALASGRPVVASDVGGIADVLRPGSGELVPPRNPQALSRALEHTLAARHDPTAISRALERPSWEGSARMLHESLLTALGEVAREAA
jgi:teichuronic acid biosynthesis glycosyltransferase TuaC